MRCLVCGGNHLPSASVCDPDGMDREATRLGAKRWNALTAHVSRVLRSIDDEEAVRAMHAAGRTKAGNDISGL